MLGRPAVMARLQCLDICSKNTDSSSNLAFFFATKVPIDTSDEQSFGYTICDVKQNVIAFTVILIKLKANFTHGVANTKSRRYPVACSR